MNSFFIYLIIMSLTTYLIRAVPFALIGKKIQNPFVQSFLYYIPYTVLTVMTFPAALYVTGSIPAAAAGLIAAAVVALKGKGLLPVAAAACITVLIIQGLLSFV